MEKQVIRRVTKDIRINEHIVEKGEQYRVIKKDDQGIEAVQMNVENEIIKRITKRFGETLKND